MSGISYLLSLRVWVYPLASILESGLEAAWCKVWVARVFPDRARVSQPYPDQSLGGPCSLSGMFTSIFDSDGGTVQLLICNTESYPCLAMIIHVDHSNMPLHIWIGPGCMWNLDLLLWWSIVVSGCMIGKHTSIDLNLGPLKVVIDPQKN